jgi:drug/metabolite transporter (DMT)-like permease
VLKASPDGVIAPACREPDAVPSGDGCGSGRARLSDTPLRPNDARAALAAAIGSTCVGFVPFFVTGLQKAGFDTVSILLYRYLVALTVLVPLALATSPGIGREIATAGRWLFLNGLTLGAFQTYLYFKAIETVATSVVITVFYCYPVITLLIDRYFFGIAQRWSTFVALGVVLLGVVATSLPGLIGAALDPVGLAFAAATAFGYAAYIAVAYPLTRRLSTFTGAMCIYGSLATAYAIAVLFIGGPSLPREPWHWFSLLAIGTLGGAVQIAAFSYALPRLSSSGYSLIVCMELVTVVLVGVTLLGENLVPIQMLGIVLVLSGILFERWMRSRPG